MADDLTHAPFSQRVAVDLIVERHAVGQCVQLGRLRFEGGQRVSFRHPRDIGGVERREFGISRTHWEAPETKTAKRITNRDLKATLRQSNAVAARRRRALDTPACPLISPLPHSQRDRRKRRSPQAMRPSRGRWRPYIYLDAVYTIRPGAMRSRTRRAR